jgi:hypothetical protein
MEMSDVTRAIAAATSVAASLDLPANDAIVLHGDHVSGDLGGRV